MKLIKLTKGYFAQVDDEDFEYLNQFKWRALKTKRSTTYYATRRLSRKLGVNKDILMHRELLGLTNPKIKGDHIDHDGLNNQKFNLRIATNTQNSCNRTSYGVSKYLGVSFKKATGKWEAKIKHNKKDIYICHVSNEIEAAKAYDLKAKELHGEFANLNFK